MKAPNFPYQGSKFGIRDWVLSFMPLSGRTYVEPFAGRGNMFFLAKERLAFRQWYINDLNSIPFFQSVLNVNTGEFPDKSDYETFLRLKGDKENDLSRVLEPALSHMGHYKGGWAGKYTRTRKYDKQAYAQKISLAREMLQDVKMTDLTWQQLPLKKYTSKDFVYLDPPYMDTDNRHYRRGADEVDHPRLLGAVRSLKSRWLLSHTYHPYYLSELGKPVAVKQRKAAGKAANHLTGEVVVECLWRGNC